MKLKDFLRINDISYRDFCNIIGTSLFTLHGIISGKRLPTMTLAKTIEEKTLGSVTLYDWFSEKINQEDEEKKNYKPKNKKDHN